MSDLFIDMGGLYESARTVAHAAVIGSPGASYGLEDVLPLEAWPVVAGSGTVSLVPVHGTFNGCVEGLLERQVDSAAVLNVDGLPPAGSAVTVEDMQIARAWLAEALAGDLDEDQRQNLIDTEAIAQGWPGDAVRITSLMLALVFTAGAAASHPSS